MQDTKLFGTSSSLQEVRVHRLASRFARALPQILLALSFVGFAQEQTSPTKEPAGQSPIHPYMRASRTVLRGLNSHGISFQAMLVYDWSKSLASDTDATGGFGRYSLDLLMPVDGKEAFGIAGSSGLVRLKHHLQSFGGTYDGEAQLYSNIDSSSRTTLYEAWFTDSSSPNKSG